MAAPKTDQERNPDKYFASPAGHPKDRIVLHETAEATKGGRFFSLNGFPFLAQSGVEIDVPRPVRKMLDTLIRTENVTHDDGTGKLVRESRNVPRFPYVLVKEGIDAIPEAAVIDAAKADAGTKPAVDYP